MPTYDYQCYRCNATKEEHHKPLEEPVILCHICNQPMKKVILQPPNVKFSNIRAIPKTKNP